MITYLVRRCLTAILLLWAALSTTFFLLHLSPGDPTARLVSPEIPPAMLAQLRRGFGLDEPLLQQYGKWLAQYLTGDFGISLSYHRPVAEMFAEALPATLALTFTAITISLVVGTLAGALAALRQGRPLDRLLMNAALTCYCMPSFWVAVMLVLLFAVKLHWLPPSHSASLFVNGDSGWQVWHDRARHLVLPVTTLALGGMASTARFVREQLAPIMDSPFMRLARAKGLSDFELLRRHALRHALLPVISLLGLSLPFLLGGSFIVETIFAWPGMGRITYEAIFARDYPVVLAATALSALLVIAGNLFADLLYRVADPRISGVQPQERAR